MEYEKLHIEGQIQSRKHLLAYVLNNYYYHWSLTCTSVYLTEQ